jgi:hypothetical protein
MAQAVRGSGAFRSVDLASRVLTRPLRSSSEAVAQIKTPEVKVSAMKPACEGPVERSEARMLT